MLYFFFASSSAAFFSARIFRTPSWRWSLRATRRVRKASKSRSALVMARGASSLWAGGSGRTEERSLVVSDLSADSCTTRARWMSIPQVGSSA